MNYELAKQLKDAGYEVKNPSRYSDGIPITLHDDCVPIKNVYLIPSLEELIEACGDEFGELMRWKADGWYACKTDEGGSDRRLWKKTPLEAVADLWLSLNKK